MPSEKIRYHYWENVGRNDASTSPGQIIPSLKRSLGQYYRSAGTKDLGVYVGITVDPEMRFEQHQSKMLGEGYSEWEEMIVVYATSSLSFAIQVENAMIEHLRSHHRFKEVGFNKKGTQFMGRQRFSLYLLVDDIATIPLPRNSALVIKEPGEDFVTYWPEDRCSGHYDARLIATLKRRLDKYAASQSTIYVGMTNDPHRRLGEHCRNKEVDGMIVLYESSSLDYVALAEAQLIEYAKTQPDLNCINDKASPMLNAGTFYVYFLLDRGR